MPINIDNIRDPNFDNTVTSATGVNVRDMSDYFGSNNAAIAGSVPQNAWTHGIIIQDRTLARILYKGLRANHIVFQYMETIPSRSKTAEYEQVETNGRFEKINIYKGSNNMEFELVIRYYAEGTEDPRYNHKTKWTIELIDRLTKRLEALVYPAYDGNFAPPPRCLLNIGTSYRDFPMIVKSVSVLNKAPFRVSDGESMFKEIILSCVSDYPISQAVGSQEIFAATYDQSAIDQGDRVFSQKKFNLKSRRRR